MNPGTVGQSRRTRQRPSSVPSLSTKCTGRIRSCAAALGEVSDDVLRERFDPTAMRKADIYPDIWEEGRPVLEEELLSNLAALRRIYAEAAGKGCGVIAGIS